MYKKKMTWGSMLRTIQRTKLHLQHALDLINEFEKEITPPTESNCAFCGSTFKPRQIGTQYCSDACRTKVYWQKRRQRTTN
jgi:predicted nucleic acid-binding Zn ribbon protein